MALVSLPGGFRYGQNGGPLFASVTSFPVTAIDATGEKTAFIGYIDIVGRPTAAKTFSSAGGKIHWVGTSVTFANGGTQLDVGIQDVSGTAGPPCEPDGSFDVSATLIGGTDTINNNATTTTAMETGTKSITHGDAIAVVFDMVSRAGADTIALRASATNVTGNILPTSNVFAAAAWAAGNERLPFVVIEFDDGTLATLAGGSFWEQGTALQFDSADNPDEVGNIFQVPFDCKVGGIWARVSVDNASSDFTLKLYSDPLGTPALVGSIAVDSAHSAITTTAINISEFLFAQEISLSKNTDYAVTILAGGSATNDTRLEYITLMHADHRAIAGGGINTNYVSRNDSSGAFSETTTQIAEIGVIVTQIDDGTGSGGGSRAYGIQPIPYGV